MLPYSDPSQLIKLATSQTALALVPQCTVQCVPQLTAFAVAAVSLQPAPPPTAHWVPFWPTQTNKPHNQIRILFARHSDTILNKYNKILLNRTRVYTANDRIHSLIH